MVALDAIDAAGPLEGAIDAGRGAAVGGTLGDGVEGTRAPGGTEGMRAPTGAREPGGDEARGTDAAAGARDGGREGAAADDGALEGRGGNGAVGGRA